MDTHEFPHRYRVQLTYEDHGVVDFASTDDLSEALQVACRQAYQAGVSDVRVYERGNHIYFVCEKV